MFLAIVGQCCPVLFYGFIHLSSTITIRFFIVGLTQDMPVLCLVIARLIPGGMSCRQHVFVLH